MTKSHWLGLGVLLLGGSIGAQAQRSCASHDLLLQQMADDPKRATVMAQIEDHIARFEANGGGATESAVVTIPTVVHVVYNNSTENISDAQVLSQIRILNEDFRRTNSDADGTWSQAADTEIEFCLATIDPSGNPTTGITRTSTTRTSFSTSNNVKFNSQGGKDAWPRDQYLNIWVCDLGGGLLGYAQFPGGPASTDGVVCDYAYFGDVGVATPPFDLGRTATHEVGHWLNLRHIWGDGGCSVDDGVSDTPASDGPNYGCALGTVSCSSTDMVQNYMDYSDDGCMNLFTAGQKTRMQAVLAPGGPRNSLLSAGVCGTPPDPTCTDGIQNGLETGVDCGGPDCPACPPCTDVTVSINLDNYPQETSWQITNSSGTVVASGGTYGSLPDGSNVTEVNCLTDGCYTFTIFDSFGDGICCGYGTGDYTVSVAGAGIVASGGSFGSIEATPFCIGGGGGGCSAPTGLTVVGTTSNSASLAWNATAGALGYQAQGRRAGTSTFRQRTTGTNSLTVPGLPAATTFEWQVRVQCGDGTISPWSALSTFTTTTLREGAVADVRLYPNPASSRVRVEGLPQGEVWYRLVDRTGRLVANGQYTDGPAPLELNTESLADGLYLLQWHSLEQQGGIDLLIAH
jgi:hypothetical protein